MPRINNARLSQIERLQEVNATKHGWPSSMIAELLTEISLLRLEKKSLQRKFDALVDKIKRIEKISTLKGEHNENA